jgi:hypothetical protein
VAQLLQSEREVVDPECFRPEILRDNQDSHGL